MTIAALALARAAIADTSATGPDRRAAPLPRRIEPRRPQPLVAEQR